jgi:hypothetical protein
MEAESQLPAVPMVAMTGARFQYGDYSRTAESLGLFAQKFSSCHRSFQNQPAGVEPKPATLRRGVDIISSFQIKGFRR